MTSSHVRRDFAARLDKARRDQHLSIRGLAGAVGVPHSTVQGWLNGKNFPTPALRPDYLRLVEVLGLSDALTDDLWVDVQPQLRKGPAPYLGLRPFSASDRDLYFGRAREARRLAESVMSVENSLGGGIRCSRRLRHGKELPTCGRAHRWTGR